MLRTKFSREKPKVVQWILNFQLNESGKVLYHPVYKLLIRANI